MPLVGCTPEKFGRGPAELVRLSAVLIEEGQRVRPDRRPLRRGEIPAGGGVLGQTLDLVAPEGDGGEDLTCRRITIEWLPNDKPFARPRPDLLTGRGASDLTSV